MHIATLNSVNMLLLLLHAVVVMLLVAGKVYGRAARWFAASSLLRAAALAGLGWGGGLQLAVAMHVWIVAGFVLIYPSFSEVVGEGARCRRWVAGIGVVGAVCVIVAEMQSERAFEMAFSAVLFVLLAATGLMILRCREAGLRLPSMLAGGVFLAYALLHAGRTLAVMFGGRAGDAASLQIWLVGSVLANAGMVFGFLLLVTSQMRLTIEGMAQRDPLTGVLNRLGLEQLIAPQLEGRKRHGTPVSAIMLDLDGMKLANDTYGHTCGDEVLVTVCGELVRVLNGRSTPARMGGDEFLVVMDMEEAKAVTLAEEMRCAVNAIRLADWPGLRVSASFGVASLPGVEWSLHQLLCASDQALLRAKAEGKNRVVV